MLVIRVWEEDGEPGLRARLTQTADVEARDSQATVEMTAATREEILDAVGSWLEGFLSNRGDRSSDR